MADDSAGSEGVFRQRLRRELGLDTGEGGTVERAAQLVRNYGAGGYTGAAFDTYGHNDSARITADDLLSITMLSIQIREQSNSSLRPSSILRLESMDGRAAGLLRQVPADREIHLLDEAEFDRWLGPESAGEALYQLLRQEVSIPRVAVYKLLARKRPLLWPIRDTVVEKALGQNQTDPWWRPWWETLSTDPAVVAQLAAIRRSAGCQHLSLLRVADIVLWMSHRPAGDTEEAG